ncbi:MAG: ribulose-phosphate 3-epimerase [Clostridia bacterium]|nr:ribulose-phosphate 3-epimerase [Clostridia bacterium]
MHASQIAPSIMCVDFLKLEDTLDSLKRANIEYLHVDIMDGEFVPNYTLGPDFCRSLKAACDIPLDVHMMITHPERKLGWFPLGSGDYASVHYEAGNHPIRALKAIRDAGAKPMLALNPATPVCVLESVLDDIDAVLVMTVNPGYAGQKLIERTLDKITCVRRFLDERGYEHVRIEVDGNVSFENAKRMRRAGADIFVAGTSSIFTSAMPFDEAIIKLRSAIE